MTIETKIAKNGAKLYYYEGKRISRDKALEIAANLRGDNLFTIETESKVNVYGVTRGVKSGVTTITSKHEFKAVYMQTTYNGTMLWVSNSPGNYDKKVFAGSKDAVKKVAAAIDDAYFSGARGVKITASGEVEILPDEAKAVEEVKADNNDSESETKLTRAEIEAEIKIIVEEIDEFRNELMVIEAETEDEDFDEATCTPQSHIDYLKSTIASNEERYNELQNMLNNLDPEPPQPETDGSEEDTDREDAFDLLPEVDELNDVAESETQDDELKIVEHVRFTESGNERREFTVGNESVHYFNGELSFLWNKTYRAGISPIGECRYIVEVPDGRYVKFIRPTDEEFFQIMAERGACSFDEPETDGSEDNIELLAKLEQHYRNYRQYRWKADILNDFMDAYCTPESPVSSSDEFEIRRLFNKIAAWRNKAKDKFETLADEMMILAEKYQDVEPFWSRYKEIQHYIAVQEGFIDEEVEDIA